MIRWAIYLKSALHAFSLSNPESVEVYLAFMYFWKLSQVVHCPFSRSCLANADRTVAVVHCIAVSILVLSSSGPSCFSRCLNQSSHPFNQFSTLSPIFPLNLSVLSTQILLFFPVLRF